MDTKMQILECALHLFYEKGYNSVGIQEIVNQSGITKPTMYYYFGSKLGLLESILSKYYTELLEKLDEVTQLSTDLTNVLQQGTTVFLEFALNHKEFYSLMLSLKYTGRSNEAYKAVRPYLEKEERLLVNIFLTFQSQLGNMNGRQEQFARVYQGMLNEYAMICIRNYEEKNEKIEKETVYQLVHQYMHGIFS